MGEVEGESTDTSSPYRQDMSRNYQGIFGERKRSQNKPTHKSAISCPVCGESLSANILALRHDFRSCRTCGYENDIDNWN